MVSITTTQFTDRYGAAELENLTDRDGAGPDPDWFDRAAQEATHIIEEYLGPQSDTLPASLVGIAAALTRWHLYIHDRTDAVREGYDAAIARLKAMRNGQTATPPAILNDSLPTFASRPRDLW